MALSSAISLSTEKIKPFKQQPDLEIDDVFIVSPLHNNEPLPSYCRLSDLVASDLFRDEFTGGLYFHTHYSARDISTLEGGGRVLSRNLRVTDYENINLADWCVDPSGASELPTIKGRERAEPVLPVNDEGTNTILVNESGEILGEAIARPPNPLSWF